MGGNMLLHLILNGKWEHLDFADQRGLGTVAVWDDN